MHRTPAKQTSHIPSRRREACRGIGRRCQRVLRARDRKVSQSVATAWCPWPKVMCPWPKDILRSTRTSVDARTRCRGCGHRGAPARLARRARAARRSRRAHRLAASPPTAARRSSRRSRGSRRRARAAAAWETRRGGGEWTRLTRGGRGATVAMECDACATGQQRSGRE